MTQGESYPRGGLEEITRVIWELMHTPGFIPRVSKEMVDHQMTFADTAAGKFVLGELHELYTKLKQSKADLEEETKKFQLKEKEMEMLIAKEKADAKERLEKLEKKSGDKLRKQTESLRKDKEQSRQFLSDMERKSDAAKRDLQRALDQKLQDIADREDRLKADLLAKAADDERIAKLSDQAVDLLEQQMKQEVMRSNINRAEIKNIKRRMAQAEQKRRELEAM